MEASESQQLLSIQSTSGYYFKNLELLQQALTHDSLRVNNASLPTYQRMEFLGDSVLQFIITNYLYLKHPHANEGHLTSMRSQLVCADKQTEIARQMQIEKYVQLGDSMKGQRPGIGFKRFDCFVESVIGAVYLDAGAGAPGLTAAKNFVYKLWQLEDPAGGWCVIL